LIPSVQNTLLVTLLSTNIKIKIYRIITLFVATYACATWSLRVRKEYRLRVFEKGAEGSIWA